MHLRVSIAVLLATTPALAATITVRPQVMLEGPLVGKTTLLPRPRVYFRRLLPLARMTLAQTKSAT